jgi:hypothetical protein
MRCATKEEVGEVRKKKEEEKDKKRKRDKKGVIRQKGERGKEPAERPALLLDILMCTEEEET